MASITLAVGVLLALIGVIGYVASGMVSVTALIPLFFGVPVALLGGVAMKKPHLLKHLMHVAVLLTLLGFLGSVPGLIKLPTLFNGTAERPMAVGVQAVMAVVCLAHVALAIRSFIAARRAREAA